MAYTTLEQFNLTSLDGVLIYINEVVPFFTATFLLVIYFIIGLTAYLGSKRFSGQADIFASMTAAGFITFILAIIMTLTTGIINVFTVAIASILLIISFLLLLLKRNRD